jgi:radical SAM superfamily enzyme with C-terminal helix-hairpin-helix motif
MNTKTHILENIEFSTTDTDIRVQCLVNEGNLSYQSTVILASRWINKLLMYCQRLNPEEQIDEKMERIIFPSGTILYKLSTHLLANNTIDWEEFLGESIQLKKIRA